MPALMQREGGQETTSNDGLVVWMPEAMRQVCVDEASHTIPLETGGTFMGWWADSGTAVIRAAIGPGPNASHGRHHFQPDQDWQLDQIARHYEASGRRETYLGDWHSHPNASGGALSWTDRRVLRRVINTPSARCPTPLMIIFWGNPDGWQIATWRARLHFRPILWDRLILEQAAMKLAVSS